MTPVTSQPPTPVKKRLSSGAHGEVSLLTDRDQTIPVLNTRTGLRGIAYGNAGGDGGGGLELRYMASNADVQEGDLLTTSGVDGVYPPGLPVARVQKVERRADSAFARILCRPVALVEGARHVMVLKPMTAQIPARPAPEDAAPAARAGAAVARPVARRARTARVERSLMVSE